MLEELIRSSHIFLVPILTVFCEFILVDYNVSQLQNYTESQKFYYIKFAQIPVQNN